MEGIRKFSPRRPGKKPGEYREMMEEVLSRPLPTEEERRIRVTPEESVIELKGAWQKIFDELVDVIDQIMEQRKELERSERELKGVLEKMVEEGLHVKLKPDVDVDEVLEMLRKSGVKLGSLERILVLGKDKFLRLRAQVRLGLKETRRFSIEIEERLKKILGPENQEAIKKVIDLIKEFLSATVYYVSEVGDITENLKKEIEKIEKGEERRSSVYKEEQFRGFWEKIKSWFRRLFDTVRRWLGLADEVEEVVEESIALVDEISEELEVVLG